MWYFAVEQQRRWLRSFATTATLAQRVWASAGLVPMWASPVDADWVADVLGPLIGPFTAPPPFGIQSVSIDGRVVPVTERVAASMPFCRLLHFARGPGTPAVQHGRAILLCAPLAGHAAVMLRETAETLLEDGDVYLTDWADARDVPVGAGSFGLDDYVRVVEQFIEHVRAESRSLHVIAVCQATNPALAALARLASRSRRLPDSATLIGGPIDARPNPTALGRFAATHSADWFWRNAIDTVPPGYAGAGRRVFPAYLQQAEILAAYPRHYFALLGRYARALAEQDGAACAGARRTIREYASFLDMPAEYFLDTLKVVFQDARLACGTWRVAGRLVRPERLSGMLLLTIEGGDDDVTGGGQTHCARALCSGIPPARKHRLDIAHCDHHALFSGPHWRGEIHHAIRTIFALSDDAQHASAA
jgi:polyhydroxyalkanoate depolymerase